MKTKFKLLAALLALLTVPILTFGQGTAGPSAANSANYNSFIGAFDVPSVSWTATGLTLTYTGGNISPGGAKQAITGATLTMTDAKNTCTLTAIMGATDACNYVYWSSGTSLSTTTTFATATAAGKVLLYYVNTTGGNIVQVTPASALFPGSAPVNITAQAAGGLPLSVANGGTGLASGASGGILGYTAAGTLASSGALTANAIVLGGGAGATPTILGSLGTTTTLLHGNAAGAPSFSAVVLTTDISGILPVANGGTNLASGTSGGVLGYTAAGTLASSAALASGQFVLGGGAGATPTASFSVVPVANGGTNLASGTSGGVLAYTAAGTLASSGALALNGVVLGGGAGAAPTSTAAGAANTLFNVASGGGAPVWTSAAPTDGYFLVGPENCSVALTTGAFAANAANSGGLSAPALVRAASGNTVLQLVTTAAANTSDVVCEINVPSRLTAGKGISVTAIGYLFGYQTTALSSIGTATVNSITYSAAGGAAAGTVATIGGVLTVTAGTNHGTPGAVTTSGQCYSEKVAFGTPYAINTDTTRIAWQNTFTQAGASATTLQICGTIVYYTNTIL